MDMCGIVGIIDRSKNMKEEKSLKSWFKEALFCDELRGSHGTGIFSVDSRGDLEYYKRALPASTFLELKKTNKIIEDRAAKFIVGHNRWATKGAHKDDNTHPFVKDEVCLIHNGSLTGYHNLSKDKTLEVDSDILADYLDNIDAEDRASALEEVEGAYSLVWYDSLNETLNFARNDERPMYFGQIKDSESWLFGSEAGMIKWLAARNDLVLEAVNSLETGVLLSVKLNPKKDEEIYTKVTFKPKEKVKNYINYAGSYQGAGYHSNTITPPKKKEESTDTGTKDLATISNQSVLIGSFIRLKFNAWVPYNGTGKMGSLQGQFGDALVVMAGVTYDEIKSVFGKFLNYKVTSLYSSSPGNPTKIFVSTEFNTGLDIEKPITDFSRSNIAGELIHGPHGYIGLDYFNKLTKHGCSNCTCDLDHKNSKDIVWDDLSNPYCKECSELFV